MIGWTAIFSKGLAPLLFIAGGVVLGMGVQQRVLNPKPTPCPQCPLPPACICPPQTSIQPFDVNKIKNLKSFTYQPEYNGMITVAGVDSVAIKRYIGDAVVKAFSEHVKTIEQPKRKRKN